MQSQQIGFNPDYSEDEPAREQLNALSGDTIVEFGAPWCGHCLAATAAVKALFEKNPSLRHVKIYDGPGRPLGRSFRIKLWPSLILLRDGKELARVVRPRAVGDLQPILDLFQG